MSTARRQRRLTKSWSIQDRAAVARAFELLASEWQSRPSGWGRRADLAQKLGVSRTRITEYLRGERPRLSAAVFGALMAATWDVGSCATEAWRRADAEEALSHPETVAQWRAEAGRLMQAEQDIRVLLASALVPPRGTPATPTLHAQFSPRRNVERQPPSPPGPVARLHIAALARGVGDVGHRGAALLATGRAEWCVSHAEAAVLFSRSPRFVDGGQLGDDHYVMVL
jgi:transcriptional regulator with XRE-family HTH domain